MFTAGRFRRFLTPWLAWLRRIEIGAARFRRRWMPAEMVAFEDCTASWFSSALCTAVLLKLPELVEEETPLEELAAAVKVEPPALERLLRVLVSHGYFRWGGEGSVAPTTLSLALQPGRAGSFCRLQGEEWYRGCFRPETVCQALSSGESPFQKKAGHHFFEHTDRFPERAELFAQAMAEITEFTGPWLVEALQFVAGERVLDIGGGNGRLCALLSEAYPRAEFCVLDRDAVKAGFEVERRSGCFLEAVPPGYDHLLMKNILHDWDDEAVLRILGNCADSVSVGAKLSLVELLLPEEDPGSGFRDFQVDWNIFCTLGGRERTRSEYARLLERSGWMLESAKATATPLWVLRAVKS